MILKFVRNTLKFWSEWIYFNKVTNFFIIFQRITWMSYSRIEETVCWFYLKILFIK